MKDIDKELLATAIYMEEDIKFGWEKEIPVKDLVLNAIWEEIGVDIQIPVSLQNISKLKEKSSRILSFDVAGCNITCNTSRKENCFAGNSTKFLPIEKWVSLLLNIPGVAVNLEKLIIYEEDCQFEHTFYAKRFGKIGMVALQVPVEGSHKGGVFSLAYDGTTKSLKSASSDLYLLAAFYDCCERLMEPVTHGHKLTIFFNITWAVPSAKRNGIPKNFPVFHNRLQQMREALKPWMCYENFKPLVENNADSRKFCTELEEDKILFFILQEKYEMEKKLSFLKLRGKDRILLEVLMHCDFLELHLTFCAKKSLEPVDKLLLKTWRWIDSTDKTRKLNMNLNLDEQYVGPKENLIKSFDTESACIGLVIWHKKQTIQIYGRYGGLRDILLTTGNLKDLRKIILFCCSEPRKVWTQSGMGTGELTLSLLRLCITFRARNEGLILLKSISSYFDKQSQDQKTDDAVNFEGIQNEEVAKAIADFEHCVTGWDDIAEVIKSLTSRSRLTKQLVPCIKLVGFFLNSDCVKGAKMVGDRISHFLSKREVDEFKDSELQCYIDMIVSLKSNPDTSCPKRMNLFIDFCSKLDLDVFSRLILDNETDLLSKKSFQGERICSLLCEILANRFNVGTLIIKYFIVDLVRCFARFGIPHLQSFIHNICRRPKMPNPTELPDNFTSSKTFSINNLLSSSAILELLASSEQGRQAMITLLDCQFKLIKQLYTSIEKSRAPSVAEYPFKILSSCILLYMQMGRNHPKYLKRLSTISALLPKLALEELMEVLFDIPMKFTSEHSEKTSFMAELCALILSRMKENVTNMPSRILISETVRYFLKFENAPTPSLITQICKNEISGRWDHHLKLQLFQDFISSSDIWEKLDSDSISEVIKTSDDILILWISDISENISSNTNVIDSKIVDCIKCFFMIEINRLSTARSVVVHFLKLLMSKLSTLQLMDISLAVFSEENIKDVEPCFELVRYVFLLATRHKDFAILVCPARASKILFLLIWLNDKDCWQNCALQICHAMPSRETKTFIEAAVFDDTIRQALGESPFAAAALERILDCWTETQKSFKTFSWKQPFAVLKEYPEVEAYLRSDGETMTYANFSCIKDARKFANSLLKKEKKCGFSVEVLVKGSGKKSCIEMSKNREYHKSVKRKMINMNSKMEDVRKLHQYFLEKKQEHELNRAREYVKMSDSSASTESASSLSEDDECTVLPTPKRVKRNIPIINVEIEVSERSSFSGHVGSRDGLCSTTGSPF